MNTHYFHRINGNMMQQKESKILVNGYPGRAGRREVGRGERKIVFGAKMVLLSLRQAMQTKLSVAIT